MDKIVTQDLNESLLERFIELNREILIDWARIGNVDIEHLTIRDKKILIEGKSVCLTIKTK